MNRLFYILLILLSVTSCKLDEVVVNPNQDGDDTPISFSTNVNSVRTSEVDGLGLQNIGFYVSAYLDETEYGFVHYFDNLVTYESNKWGYVNPQYWTSSGSMTFDAYAYDKTILDAGVGTLTKGKRYLDYVCSPEAGEQVDILAVSANIANKQTATLDFEHALSQIKFKVDFSGTDETNVTLTKINIMYHNITSEGRYIFGSDGDIDGTTTGKGVWELSEQTYFGGGFKAVAIEPNLTEKASDGDDMIFEPTDLIMIIPQLVNITTTTTDTDTYMSVSLEYALNSAGSEPTMVGTGVMELPAPTDSDNIYKMGKAYTYSISVNGQNISIGLDIDDAEVPEYAYGNLDLRLIDEPISESEYQDAVSLLQSKVVDDNSSEDKYMYYSTAVRALKLLDDNVRDFVVVGEFGAFTDGQNDGKMGYWGSESSPFFIAATSLGMMPNYEIIQENSQEVKIFETPLEENKFSIDLRGVYGFPTFGVIHPDLVVGDHELDTDAPVLTAGLFKDLALLKDVYLPVNLSAIDKYAFQNCISLETINLSDVEHIEEGAFVDCTGLTEVIGGKLTRIHQFAFDDCANLMSIDLSLVTEIDQFGFVDCKSLEKVDINNLDIIGAHAFSGCSSLTIADNTSIPAFSNVADFAFNGCTKLGENGGKIDLSGATLVGHHAFSGCTQIILSSGELNELGYVGDYGLANCGKIGSIFDILMPKIDSLGISAFENCVEMNIVEGLDRLDYIPVRAFQGCTALTGSPDDSAEQVLSLDSAVKVDTLAFSKSGIVNIEFNSLKLKTIGKGAFAQCASLTTISGLEGVTMVDTNAFASCSQLTKLELSKATTLGSESLLGCSALNYLYLPEATTVGYDFINGCISLETFIMPKVTSNSFSSKRLDGTDYSTISEILRRSLATLREVNIESLEIDNFLWNNWVAVMAIEKINIASATAVAEHAFNSATNLVEINASGAKTIGGYAFQGCTSLQIADLSSATTIGDAIFSGCTALETVYLSSLTSIADNAFNSYTNLKTLDLSSVTSIGSGTFKYSALTELKLSSVDMTSADMFENTDAYNYPFYGLETSNCVLYLSPEQIALNVTDGNKWYGATWKEIKSE